MARLGAYGAPIAVDPTTALLLEVHRTSGHVGWLGSAIDELADIRTHEAQVLVTMYHREREHLMRVAKAAIDAGVMEREVRLAERQGELIAHVILGVLGALGLSPQQFQTARKLVGTRMRELIAGEQVPNSTGSENVDA